MSGRPAWRRVSFGGLAVLVPPGLTTPDERAVDGEVLVLAGDGLRLTLDASPFRDRFLAARPRPGRRPVPGTAAGDEVVAFDAADGGTVVAALLPEPVSASVHVGPGADLDTALDIIRSISHEREEPGR
ncbi:hypothetical protein [Aquipuribacter sp. SD81]|uniref:hypothetical protein n=1 Tax=Aquipuribacter sp. SD81 TaxID=3127703 RepID=UPI0030191605